MSVSLLLQQLEEHRIELHLEEGKLRYKAPRGALTAELRESIGAHREALIQRLSGREEAEPEILYSPVSAAQRRLWFVHQMQGPNYTYNVPLFLRLRGPLHAAALRAAVDDLARRHQSLRCCFESDGDQLRLAIRRDVRVPWQEQDTDLPLDGMLRDAAQHLFDLARAPLAAARLIRVAGDEHILALTFHHIIADGWSFGIILTEIAAGYESRLAGHAPQFPRLEWQYTDYVQWQERLRSDGTLDADLAFWRERLAGAPASTTMPPEFQRPAIQRFEGAAVPIAIDAATTARLRAQARDWGVSLNHLTLAATAILMADFTGSRDLVIGLPLANRTRRELEPLVGMFVNVVPLRLCVDAETPLRDFLAQVRRAGAEAMAHCQLPFERLVEELVVERELGRSPVFQVAYNFLPPMENHATFGGLNVEVLPTPAEAAVSKYDCTFYLEESDGAIAGFIEYSTSLYKRESVEAWARTLLSILDAMLETPDSRIGRFLTQAEARCTGPAVPIPEASPWLRFEEAARRWPDTVALEEGEARVTYAELERRAGIVAAKLECIRPGDRVGLLLARGPDAVAAMLGVVRRGAVFVPIDTEQPEQRLRAMTARAALRAIIRQPGNSLPDGLAPVEVLIDAESWNGAPEASAAAHTQLGDPLYMIFTSGSTGIPKAVEVPWRGLCNFVQAITRDFGLAPRERVSQFASLSFDASLCEIWPSLLAGCTLVFVPDAVKLDPEALRDWILRERIAVHFSPTPLAEDLFDLDWPTDSSLRLLYTGGQALHKYPRRGSPYRVMNLYGPTETSVSCTWCVVEPAAGDAGLPPIGHPADNTEIAILDESGRRVPLDAAGELYVTGAGVARGYFGDPEATARAFVTLPGDPGKIWYRTGDLVRMSPERQLQFIARVDRQIKLRGRRIEPGEIESAILGVPGVRHVAVRLEGEQLAAYVESAEPALDGVQIRRQLGTRLPDHMVPSFVTVLNHLPRTTSGKIDLNAIPRSRPEASGAPTAAGPLQAGISRAWATVLKHAVTGADDNFFDLGGHSLMLVRLKEQIRRETSRDIGILDLYRHPTIARQAAFLGESIGAEPERRPERGGSAQVSDIAIIGMAGRFPDAGNVEEFWTNLREGRDSIRRFTREELLAAGQPPELVDQPDYVPANAVLEDIEYFDAAFFGVPAREAEVMDPQQRILLEEAWHTFEDAGYDPARIDGRVGVFVGASLSAYLTANVLPRHDIVEALSGFAVLIQNDKDFAATRISYKLDLRGPSVAVNTACSTSLVAIHQAVTALRDGQCELALAGGACVRSQQIDGYRYEEGGVLARDGKCRAFDADASGMVGGNGVALVLLKPLGKALADGDHIHAVTKGIAINNDGADKPGFTAPSINGQSRVVREALERAEVDPETVTYVEAHGTGTRLGDSVEVAALSENYAPNGRRAQPLYLGSVKTNVAHLDAAAGVAGLIKTALCLEHRTLVPSLHFRTANPQIPWPGDLIQVPTWTQPLGRQGEVLRAAVSSLGLGGTNAHAILEQAPLPREVRAPVTGSSELLLVSGKEPQAREANAATLANWLGRHPEACLRDVAFTLATGRRHWDHRRAVCAANGVEAAALLAEPPERIQPAAGAVFLFSGIGIIKAGMGRTLYGTSPSFTAVLDECADLLEPVLGLDIRGLLLAQPDDISAAALINQLRVSQPAAIALQYALARFWMDLGVTPSVLVGHSLGEWAPACLAGVFDLRDALRLVSLRGGLMDATRRGGMLAVNLSEAQVVDRLPGGLDIATINAPDQTVVAGPAAAIDDFTGRLTAEGIRCKRLPVVVAAHSSLMDPALEPFREAVAATPRKQPDPSMAIVSSVTGTYFEAGQLLSPDYWSQHLRRAVRFADSLATLWARPELALLECGPSQTLCHIARRDPRRPAGRVAVGTLEGTGEADTDWRRLLETAGTLWAAGLPIDLDKLFAIQGKGRRIPLPGYAFQRQRYWLEAAPSEAAVRRQPQPAAPMVLRSNASPAETRIIGIMQELLGCQDLSRHSDFFLQGGDSLLAVRLGARIAEMFGVRPEPAELMKARTPTHIADLLALNRALDEQPSAADHCVVRLSGGNRALPPVVLIHAVGGGAFIYRDLSQALSTDHPVYGIQAPGLWDDATPIEGLREQAAHYHKALIAAGVERPLLIGGSSYGGIVAYELDGFYRQSGHNTPLLALFDSPGPGHMPQRIESEAEVFAYLLSRGTRNRNFAADLAEMEAAGADKRFSLLLENMREAVMPHAGARDVERLLRVFRQNLANMWNWVPRPQDSRILFCKAKEHTDLLAQNPELAWVPLAGAGIEILPVPGDHSSMLEFPHVSVLADELRSRLIIAAATLKSHVTEDRCACGVIESEVPALFAYK